jgi:hypothetical protein
MSVPLPPPHFPYQPQTLALRPDHTTYVASFAAAWAADGTSEMRVFWTATICQLPSSLTKISVGRLSTSVPWAVTTSPRGAATTIFNSDMVAGVKRRRRQAITLRRSTQEQPFGPARLDPELLRPLTCDYALVSLQFGAYLQQSHITALYGAVPVAGSKHLISFTPRGGYLLYDCSSGEKIWESEVGTLSVGPGGPTPDDRICQP